MDFDFNSVDYALFTLAILAGILTALFGRKRK